MPVATAVVAVGTAATALSTGGKSMTDITSVAVYNAGSNTIFIGGSTVTTATGIPLAVGATATFDLAFGDGLYGIVAAATENARVLQTRQ
jgi:hypothetical protein